MTKTVERTGANRSAQAAQRFPCTGVPTTAGSAITVMTVPIATESESAAMRQQVLALLRFAESAASRARRCTSSSTSPAASKAAVLDAAAQLASVGRELRGAALARP
jgi:hypothetical protein